MRDDIDSYASPLVDPPASVAAILELPGRGIRGYGYRQACEVGDHASA